MGVDGGEAERTVVVTGASGFLGRHVSVDLTAAGWNVVAVTRTPGTWRREVVVADLATADLPTLLAGTHAVVHLAARVHRIRDTDPNADAAFQRDNVSVTAALADAAGAAGVRTFILASSVKAVGESTAADAPWTEAIPPRPADPYGASKLAAEDAVLAAAARHDFAAACLRFPLMYGPGMRANMLRLFRAIDAGWPIPVAPAENRRSVLYVGNATAAIAAALASDRLQHERLFVSDARPVSTLELVQAIGAALGRTPRLVRVPVGLLRLLGRVGDVLDRAVPAPITSAAVNRLLGSLVVDPTRIRERLDFDPPYSLDEGLARTADWFRHREQRP